MFCIFLQLFQKYFLYVIHIVLQKKANQFVVL